MERSGYHHSHTDKVTGGHGQRVITETERERGYSVKCCGCIPLCFDSSGPLLRGDSKVFARPSGFLRLLQLIPLIVAFIAVELAHWCYHGLKTYRFFSTVTMALIWFNVLFFIIYLCQCQWRMKFCDCYILDFLYHIVAIILLIVSSIFLALNVCSPGHIVGAVFGFIAALLYILSGIFLFREYRKFRKTCQQEKAMADYNRSTMSSATCPPGSGWQSGTPTNYYPQGSVGPPPQPVLYPPPDAYDRDGRPINYYPSQQQPLPSRPAQGDGGPYYTEDMDRGLRQVPIQVAEPNYYRDNRPGIQPYDPSYLAEPGMSTYRAEEIRRW